jgi:PiT family inorganic phosphate transporter
MASTHFGFPLSTTHVINGGVMGSGIAKRLSAVRWGVAGNIVTAWLVTLPASAAIGALVYLLTLLLGGGEIGPILISAVCLVALVVVFARRLRPGTAVSGG